MAGEASGAGIVNWRSDRAGAFLDRTPIASKELSIEGYSQMTRETFFRLAHQFFVPVPDPDAELRSKIHTHIGNVQWAIYRRLEEQADQTGRMPEIPTLKEIEAQAFATWEESNPLIHLAG